MCYPLFRFRVVQEIPIDEEAKRMNEALLTVEEIAAILKIKPNTIHNKKWQERTGCPLKRIGKRNYIESSLFWGWLRSV